MALSEGLQSRSVYVHRFSTFGNLMAFSHKRGTFLFFFLLIISKSRSHRTYQTRYFPDS